jgi:DNA mismatch repair protein MutS2
VDADERVTSGHALEVLEFERVLERIASRASSELGRRRIVALRPLDRSDHVARELGRVAATMRFVSEGPNWALGPIPDVGLELAQVGAEGAVLDPISLHRIGVVLSTSRLLAGELGAREGAYPELSQVAERLVVDKGLEDTLARCVDEDGEVLSSASRDLKQTRDRLRGAHAKIVRQLEVYLGTLPERFVVPDASVTIRDGRYVVPVRREGKGEVGGIVHDESQTGATLYVEPPIAIELMNRVRDLEREEAREIRRILGELTAAVSPLRHELTGTLEALADFDGLHARARVARAWEATVPEIAPASDRSMRVRRGRHPLLLEGGAEAVVPFDLDLEADEHCVVVSGPNTGGKSVLLKAVGLIAALAQSGVVPPVGEGTRLPVFSSFFADIGDEQSIAQSLSTFSAHLANLSDLVVAADARSLVLIDEMGTGTDPAEGAALARAVIEELVERRATTLVSSHLGDLKRLDAEGSGVVNASLQFDPERMEPTYRFVKGRPGRSYGLAIARRLGFPAGVLDRAEGYRTDDTAGVEDVLARLEEQEKRAEELVHELDLARARAEKLERDVREREIALRESERTAETRARHDARKLLMDARAEVEAAIDDLKRAVERGQAPDEAARDARRRVEGAAEIHARILEDAAAGSVEVEVGEGDHVIVHETGARGRVTEVRGDRALVDAGSLRLELPLQDLRAVDAPPEKRAASRGTWRGPERGQARTEVDLRGLRVDEMEIELQRALDQAVLEDLSQLRIIHGKGTGALRQRVGEVLEGDRRVTAFRMGGPTEGGGGVTVATLGGGA